MGRHLAYVRASADRGLRRSERRGRATLGASPSGALDMAGNVDEWTEDVYVRYGAPRPRPAAGAQRVARGGANDAWHTRATARMALAPDYHDATLGFRCASGAPSHP
ncbi:MAG: SUMF1/EgtB/PvdO family nonheme iron enzyme [Sandaracinaceae bacterium]|nr:SUMF1/EgtB/PvdO family nonheme iron enzyme [Sandaracinaceae bacterium]